MTEVVERVAYAIWLKKPGGSTLLPFDLQPDHDRHIEQARAAIAAMREPTHEMIMASINCEPQTVMAGGQIFEDVCASWRAMIDEALK